MPLLLMSQTASVVFSHQGGFYNNSFNLTLTCDGSYHIRYTTNGNTPTSNSTLYTGPLFLNEDLFSNSNIHNIVNCIPSAFYQTEDVERSIVIRAAVFDNNDSCVSAVKTNTYFIRSLGCDIYKMPVISISTDSLSLFDYYTGIFVPGVHYNPEDPRHTGNYYQRGKDWERKINFEFYEQNNFGVNQQCGLRTHGNASRWFQQKGMKLYARDEYGKKRFKFPFFGNDELDDFKHLSLHPFRCSVWLQTGAQDFLAHKVASNLDIDALAVRQVSVFINGEYWGIYTLEETPDERYLEDHYEVDLEAVNIIKYFVVQEYGDATDWWTFFDWLQHSDLSQAEDSIVAFSRMDVHSLIDYMIFEIFSANLDWPFNNVRIWQPATGEPFRMLFFDGDGCFIRWYYDALNMAMNSGHDSYVLNHFLQNDYFKREFYNRYNELKSSYFSYNSLRSYLNEYQNIIEDDVPKQSERFGFPATVARWESDLDTIDTFFRMRSAAFEQELQGILLTHEAETPYFTCHPNPSSGTFIVDLGSFANKINQIDIYDFMGRNVLTTNNPIIECDLPKGIYFIKIGESTQKIIIQ